MSLRLPNICGIEPYKIISQHFAMHGFKKNNLNFGHFSCLMMISWYCGICLNEHQCFERKDEQYHFKLCSEIKKLNSAISAIKEDTLTPLKKQKLIVNLKLSVNTDQLTLSVLKTELKRKNNRIRTAFEDAYRRNQFKKTQFPNSRKCNSNKTNSNTRVNVSNNDCSDGQIQRQYGKGS